MKTLKQKIIVVVATLGIILIAVFQRGLYTKPIPASDKPQTEQTQEPQIVKANFSDGETVMANQIIEVTFNLPVENVGELKNRFEPKVDYTVSLSPDRKTAKFTPKTTWGLGLTYTIFILPDTKFDGKKLFNRDFITHFKTISYNGV